MSVLAECGTACVTRRSIAHACLVQPRTRRNKAETTRSVESRGWNRERPHREVRVRDDDDDDDELHREQTRPFDRRSETECGAVRAKARNVAERVDGEPPLALQGDAGPRAGVGVGGTSTLGSTSGMFGASAH